MCEQCEANTETLIRNVIPGWHLLRATRNGDYMEKGDWGLVNINDPAFYWKTIPVCSDSPSFNRVKCEIEEALQSTPDIMFRFCEDLKKSGYTIEQGNIAAWLTHRMALAISKCEHAHLYMTEERND
jgi:hypothetical protein